MRLRSCAAQLPVRRRRPAWKLLALALDAVGRAPRAAGRLGVTRIRNVQSGRRPPDAVEVQLEHRVDTEPAREPLIRDGRIEVAVADDVGPRSSAGPDHRVDVLGPRGGDRAQPRPTAQTWSPWRSGRGTALTELGAARLAGYEPRRGPRLFRAVP